MFESKETSKMAGKRQRFNSNGGRTVWLTPFWVIISLIAFGLWQPLPASAAGVTLSATPTSRTVSAGQSTTYTINISRTNFTGSVTLSVSGLRSTDGKASFNNRVTAGNTSTLTVSAFSAARPGTRTLRISATATGLTSPIAPIEVTLIIPGVTLTNVFPPPVSITRPTSLTVSAGRTATYSIFLERTSYPGSVSLSIGGLPAGAASNSVSTFADSVNLTVNTAPDMATGTWTLTVSGTATGATVVPMTLRLTVIPCEFSWTTQFGSTTWNWATAATDSSGNVYVAGTTRIDIDGAGPETHQGNSDAFLAKYNSSGLRLWIRQIGTSGGEELTGLAVSGTDIYIAGEGGDFDGSGPGQAGDGFVAKYDSAGQLSWVKQIIFRGGPVFNWGKIKEIAADSSGNIYLAVTRDNTQSNSSRAAGLIKLNSAGTEQWNVICSGATAFNVTLDSSSNVFVSGISFLDKYDGAGTRLWDDNIFSSWAIAVAVDSTGNVYIGGDTWFDLDGPGPGTHFGYSDAFLAKYDAGGTLLWTRQFGTSQGEFVMGMDVDSSDNIYVAGETAGDIDGPLPGTNAGGLDAFVARYDSNGNRHWVKQFGSSEEDRSTAIAITSNGEVYLAGTTQGDLFGAYSNSGGNDVWIARLSSDPFITDFTPTGGRPGTQVVITGSNFAGVTSVKFNGFPAAFTVNSSTQITATVPQGATTGRITISRDCWTAAGATDFILDGVTP